MDEANPETTQDGVPSIGALEEFVASVQHLPLFTGVAAQLIQSVERDDVTNTELARLISTDAALAVQMLRMVNSSYYGLSRKIGTVSDALTVLGLNLVRRLITAAVLQRPLFAYLHDSEASRAFWRHELLCASLARHLALPKKVDGELAYMAGLLHDVGRLAMMIRLPEAGDTLLARSDDHDGVALERERFGFDHAQVGGALLELWGVPEQMVQAVHQHADMDEPEDALAACVWHANLLAHRLVEAPDVDDPDLLAVGLDAAVRRRILDEVAAIGSA